MFDHPDWPRWRAEFAIPHDVTYLNHGSFGPSPLSVQQARREWSERLERQPMDFFVRQFERHLDDAAGKLGDFIGADAGDLIFVENATAGMNIVAASVELAAGDEVLLGDQEYGAVLRIWRTYCQRAGANVVVRQLPSPLTSQAELAESLMSGVTARTRLIVVSHVTSPTAVIFPVEEICRQARERGVPVCIDGPHAVAMLPLDLRRLDCDFYAASCHKWLSAPFGSGFLYVHRRRQPAMKPTTISWGGSVSGRPASWKDEFNWSGTRDPAAYLTIPAAIEFLERIGLETFRTYTHALAQYARRRIVELTGLEPLVPDSPAWYGSMFALPLPPLPADRPKQGHRDPLQEALWERHQIEVPVTEWKGRRLLRVSCHLYNRREDVDRLVGAVAAEL